MTDNEIIKAMEYIADTEDYKLTNYPDRRAYNATKVINLALDLINRLQADKEALIAGQETLQKALAEKIAELERFKKIETAVNDFWSEMQKLATFKKKRNPTLEELLEYIDNLKVEIIKEFTLRFKSLLAVNGQVSNEEYYYITTDIDNLAKEMEGDAK